VGRRNLRSYTKKPGARRRKGRKKKEKKKGGKTFFTLNHREKNNLESDKEGLGLGGNRKKGRGGALVPP